MFIVHLPFLSIISLLSPQWLACLRASLLDRKRFISTLRCTVCVCTDIISTLRCTVCVCTGIITSTHHFKFIRARTDRYQQPCDVISISALLVDWSIVARPTVDLNLNPPEALPLPEARKGRRPSPIAAPVHEPEARWRSQR
jgi:hypothetical protein